MIEVSIIKDSTLRIILSGADVIDDEILKQLNGATCRIATDNVKLIDKNLSNCLIIEKVNVNDRKATTVEGPSAGAE